MDRTPFASILLQRNQSQSRGRVHERKQLGNPLGRSISRAVINKEKLPSEILLCESLHSDENAIDEVDLVVHGKDYGRLKDLVVGGIIGQLVAPARTQVSV